MLLGGEIEKQTPTHVKWFTHKARKLNFPQDVDSYRSVNTLGVMFLKKLAPSTNVRTYTHQLACTSGVFIEYPATSDLPQWGMQKAKWGQGVGGNKPSS